MDAKLADLVRSARKRCKRMGWVPSTLTFEQIKKVYDDLGGKCYYTGVEMTPKGECMVSLERKDPLLKEYTLENCTLCISECNTVSQWSTETVTFLRSSLYRSARYEQDEIDEIIDQCTRNERSGYKTEGRCARGYRNQPYTNKWWCRTCSQYLDRPLFAPDDVERPACGRCRECYKKIHAEQHDTPRGFFQGLFRGTLNSTKIRERILEGGKSLVTRIDLTRTLTFSEMLDQFASQNGTCYLSGKRLDLFRFSPWTASIERLDNRYGYTRENIRFIAAIFQCGHGQWTPALYSRVILGESTRPTEVPIDDGAHFFGCKVLGAEKEEDLTDASESINHVTAAEQFGDNLATDALDYVHVDLRIACDAQPVV